VKVFYRRAAEDDIVRQFRYYLVELDLPKIAVRFKEAVVRTVRLARQRPAAGARFVLENPRLRGLRSWPVVGFESLRIYYLVNGGAVYIVRVLHGKRDVKGIMEDADDQ
jgi:plasmid stabilization system protein ParE